MIVESLKEEKMYVKFSNNVEAEHRGSYLDVEGIKKETIGMANVDVVSRVGEGVEARMSFRDLKYVRSDLGLLLQPELPEYKWGRITKDIVVKSLPSVSTGFWLRFSLLMPQVVKSRDEIFSRWGYCDNHDLSRSFVKLFVKLFVGIFWKAKQSDQLEWVLWYAPWLSDQLEWVLWYAPWLSDQLEWICGMLHGLVINWSSSAIETSRNRVNVFFIYHSNDLIGFKGELHENIGVREILFLYCYAFSVSLLLTPLCCDDIHDVTPRVSALAGCDTPIRTSFGFHPFQFSYPPRKLTMEEMLYKFIDKGRREHEEIGAYIREFKTTNELLLKERNNSLSELTFEVYGLSKAINNAQLSNYEVKGVTTRGGKTTTEIIHDTNDINKEPLILHHDKPVESN
ncbi:hypothetical protein Tco_0470943 [Tanacetum coccineum]